MNTTLPFDLLPHLEGTDIAATFGLTNEGEPPLTRVNLQPNRARELVTELGQRFAAVTKEAAEIQRKMVKEAKPVGLNQPPSANFVAHQAALARAQRIRQAFQFIERKLPPVRS